jgi:hypothetical protein
LHSPDITIEQVSAFLAKMYRANADFLRNMDPWHPPKTEIENANGYPFCVRNFLLAAFFALLSYLCRR